MSGRGAFELSKTMMPELMFLPNEAGEGEGLSDAGIETYRADPFPAVARETGQNSRDAHDNESCPGIPVKIVIKKTSIRASSLPDHSKYRAVTKRCLELATRFGRKKEQAFFDQALRILDQEYIPVLQVSDFNTMGLRGPCVEGSPFHSLVKSSGVSNKGTDTSGGSFGIGKSAVFSASDLQAAFYSTSYRDEHGARIFLCQGKTKFMSFTNDAGESFRSIGYWGDPNGYLPIADESLVPEWLRRSETGTTVHSIAVRESDDWENEITASLLMNFFAAIHANQMEFKVDGQELNSRTLRNRFDHPAIAAAVKKAKEDDYAFARSMYDCLTNEHEAVEHLIDVPAAGRFRLRLIVKDGLPKRVGILRNGMYICDNLAHFGDKFSRFPMYRDFVALLEPADDAANAWLRRMENPRHDEFSPERLLTPEERRAAALAGQQLASSIREEIKVAAKPEAKEETDLDELSEFFALDNTGQKDDDGARDIRTFKVQKNLARSKRKTKSPTAEADGSEGGASTEHGDGGIGGNGTGTGTGTGTGGKGTKSARKPFVLLEPRTLLPDPADLRRRRVFFTPQSTGRAVLKFESSGLSEAEELRTVPSVCSVDCVAGKRQEIDVNFAEEYDGPIEIVSWSPEEGKSEA